MRWIAALALVCVLAVPAHAQPSAGSAPVCGAPGDLTKPTRPLTGFTAALSGKQPVEILALGSGSTVGETGTDTGEALAAHTPGASFPYRTADALRAARPGTVFNLTVLGGRGTTAQEMLPVLRQALESHHYDLLLWQTGTVEAVRSLPTREFQMALAEGLAAAAAGHVDAVLIDPQFSRFLRSNIDTAPYETVMQQAATRDHAILFQRLALTRLWVEAGVADMERARRDERGATLAMLNTCLGRALADFLLDGTPR